MKKVITEQTKLWNKQYILVIAQNTLISFAFFMTATILSKYLVGIGISMATAGVIVGLFSITSLCCRPFSGIFSDRFNNVMLLRVSSALMGVGVLGFAFTTNTPLIVLFRIANGMGFAFAGTCQISLASKYIPKDRMGEGIGYLGLGMIIGSAVAPGLGVTISEGLGMQADFLISALLTMIGVGITFFLQEPEKDHPAEKKKLSFRDIIAVEALPFAVVAGTYSLINGIVSSYLVLYADELGISGVGIYFTVCAIVLFLTRPFSGKLMDKKGIRVTVLPGLIMTASSMFLLGRSHSLIAILATGVLRSIGQGAGQPSLQAGCLKRVGKDRSGVATSTYYLGGDVFQGTGPMIGGAIIGAIAGVKGYRVLFDLTGVLMLCAFVFFVIVTGKDKRYGNTKTIGEVQS